MVAGGFDGVGTCDGVGVGVKELAAGDTDANSASKKIVSAAPAVPSGLGIEDAGDGEAMGAEAAADAKLAPVGMAVVEVFGSDLSTAAAASIVGRRTCRANRAAASCKRSSSLAMLLPTLSSDDRL